MTFYFLISLKIIIKKSSTQLVEKVKNDTIQGDDADTTNTILNNQSQSYTTENNNDEHLNKHTDDKMKALEDSFHIKMGLMEVNNDIVQKELAALKQKERHQDEENKRLKERLARMEATMQHDANNNPNDDSSDGGDNDSATNNVDVSEGNSYALPEELAALEQNEHCQDEEHR
jgi:bisphosphoglycerate-dependent phosphoglycerate mutase